MSKPQNKKNTKVIEKQRVADYRESPGETPNLRLLKNTPWPGQKIVPSKLTGM